MVVLWRFSGNTALCGCVAIVYFEKIDMKNKKTKKESKGSRHVVGSRKPRRPEEGEDVDTGKVLGVQPTGENIQKQFPRANETRMSDTEGKRGQTRSQGEVFGPFCWEPDSSGTGLQMARSGDGTSANAAATRTDIQALLEVATKSNVLEESLANLQQALANEEKAGHVMAEV